MGKWPAGIFSKKITKILQKIIIEQGGDKKMKITGIEDLYPNYFDVEDVAEDDNEDLQMPYYCQKCNHNEDWPECVVECRKWRAEL